MYASSFNDTMLSHVLDVQLFDSSTTSAGSLNVTTVSGGVDLHIHVTTETNNTYKVSSLPFNMMHIMVYWNVF